MTHLKLEACQQSPRAGEQQQEPVDWELVDQDEHAHQSRLQRFVAIEVVVLVVVAVVVVVLRSM